MHAIIFAYNWINRLICLNTSLLAQKGFSEGFYSQEGFLRVFVGFLQVSEQMGKMIEEGINSFKFFFAYKGQLMVTDEQFIKALIRCKELGAVPRVPPLTLAKA